MKKGPAIVQSILNLTKEGWKITFSGDSLGGLVIGYKKDEFSIHTHIGENGGYDLHSLYLEICSDLSEFKENNK